MRLHYNYRVRNSVGMFDTTAMTAGSGSAGSYQCKADHPRRESRLVLGLLAAVACVSLTACNLQVASLGGSTPTAFIITSTLPPTAIPSATLTPVPPTPTATIVPIDGMTTTQVNVRSGPSTTAAQLGILAPFVKVGIIGRDSGAGWYAIQYPQGPGGIGWVTAQYINARNKDVIPVIRDSGGSATAESPTGTPAASGTMIQPIVGGEHSAGDGADLAGEVPAASVTPAIAPQDGDSAQSPAVSISLSPTGTRSLIYSSDVSAPEGDTEDFVRFTSAGTTLLIGLTCSGNGQLNTQLNAQGDSVLDWGGLGCGTTRSFRTEAGTAYLLRLSVLPSGKSPGYVRYTIRLSYTG